VPQSTSRRTPGPGRDAAAAVSRLSAAHRPALCLVAATLASLLLTLLAGCQTPPQGATPVYGAYPTTVPPPATGMTGQPAPYGGYVATPQGAAYPPAAPVMPGPTTSAWPTAAAPATVAAPSLAPPQATAPNSSWTWAQSGQAAAPPTIQQYPQQLANQANQYGQGLNQQAQQYAAQLQQQPQQFANQAQQTLAQQQAQLNNQLQATANQYQQGFNNQGQQNVQQGQQALTNQVQQALPQAPQQQTVNGSWWPFTDPGGLPPARTTPALPARY